MTQAGPNDALHHLGHQGRRRLQRRADVASTLLTAALVIGLHAAWFGWQTPGAPASDLASALVARPHAVSGTASF